MTWKDACSILGVSPETPMNEIKRVYRQRMLQLHPDVSPAASYPYTVQEVNRAYGFLKKGEAREPDRGTAREEASRFWDAPLNQHAYREREIYCPAEGADGEVLGHFSLARGKYLWTPEEEFSLFLQSIHHCARQILEEWEAGRSPSGPPEEGPPADRMALLAELTYLLAQQYVDGTALLEALAREEAPAADGSRLFFLPAVLEGCSRRLEPGEVLYPARVRRHRLYVRDRSGQELGYLSFPDNRLYYAVIPLFEQRRVLVKIRPAAGESSPAAEASAPTAGGSRRRSGRRATSGPHRLRLWLKLPPEHSAMPEDLNGRIRRLLEGGFHGTNVPV